MAILRVKPALQKPVVGGSINEWGDILNSNIDVQDNFNNSILIDSEAKDSEIERLDREKVSRTDVDTVVQTSVDEYINTNGNVKLDEHVESVNKPELDRYTEEKKKDIGNVINDLGSYNINTKSNYKTWIGSESDYQSLSVKENGVLYMTFDSLFNVATKYFKPKLDVVKNGLVCWLDGRDGANRNTTWKDRSGNGNDATLHNFNWTTESGFTGKSLKFDGINDYCSFNKEKINKYIKDNFVTFSLKVKTSDATKRFFSTSIRYDDWASIDTARILVYNKNGVSYNIPIEVDMIMYDLVCDGGVTKIYSNGSLIKEYNNTQFLIERSLYVLGRQGNSPNHSNFEIQSFKLYNRALTPKEIKQNYEYEQTIDRIVPTTYPLVQETKDYCIGDATDLTEEQKKTFRLSIDKTKFVSGINNIKGIAVETYTYSEIIKLMETPEWRSEEENIISDNMVKNINGEWR